MSRLRPLCSPLVVALAIGAFAGPLAGNADALVTGTSTYSTPGDQFFTVPAGVISITVSAVGAAGGDCTGASTAEGGEGASIEANLPVVPGEQLIVIVGAPGAPATVRTAAPVGPVEAAAAAAGRATAPPEAAAHRKSDSQPHHPLETECCSPPAAVAVRPAGATAATRVRPGCQWG